MTQPDYVRYRDSAKSLARCRGLSAGKSHAQRQRIRPHSWRSRLLRDGRRDQAGAAAPRPLSAADECARPIRAGRGVSESAWRTRFNADRTIVGRTILLNRVPFIVIGVAPEPGLAESDQNSDCDVWVPYAMLGQLRPSDEYFADLGAQWLNVIGRRRPDYSLRQVQEELRVLARAADENVPGRQTSLIVTDGSLIKDPEVRDARR